MAYIYKVGDHLVVKTADGLVEAVGEFPFEQDEDGLAIPDFDVDEE